VYGPDHVGTTNTYHTLGEILRKMGQHAAAREPLDRAVKVAEATLDPKSPDLAQNLNSRALNFQSLGELAAAEADFRRALSIREAVLPEADPRVAETLEGYGVLLRASGRTAEAEPLEVRARAIRAKRDAKGRTSSRP